jgi:hypothetical protein
VSREPAEELLADRRPIDNRHPPNRRARWRVLPTAAMERLNTASHTQWECKYHVVFIPKCRRKVLYGELRQYLGDVFRKLALQKESRRRGLTMRHWSAVFSPAG